MHGPLDKGVLVSTGRHRDIIDEDAVDGMESRRRDIAEPRQRDGRRVERHDRQRIVLRMTREVDEDVDLVFADDARSPPIDNFRSKAVRIAVCKGVLGLVFFVGVYKFVRKF